MSAALREALATILREHPEAFLIGEDIGVYGGAFKITRGFVHEFGAERVVDTPISEAGFVGVACGAALMGSHPVAEIMFMDFMTLTMDALINVAVKWEAVYGNDYRMPLIVRTPSGAGRHYGPTHSQSFEGLLTNVPGLTVLCPSNPADAAGLLLGAYESQRVVVFVEHKALYARQGRAPDEWRPIPIGKARLLREGSDLSLFTYGRHVYSALQAARELAADGIEAEVVDLRSIKPLDEELILESFSRTGRGMSIEESPAIGGVGAEIAAVLFSKAFEYIEAPFARLGAAEQPVPCCPALEESCFPSVADIVAKARELCAW